MSNEEGRASKRPKHDYSDVVGTGGSEEQNASDEAVADEQGGGDASTHEEEDAAQNEEQQQQLYEDEFDSETAYCLEGEVLPENPGPLAVELLAVARDNPAGVREWMRGRADLIACNCETPLPKWDRSDPNQKSRRAVGSRAISSRALKCSALPYYRMSWSARKAGRSPAIT